MLMAHSTFLVGYFHCFQKYPLQLNLIMKSDSSSLSGTSHCACFHPNVEKTVNHIKFILASQTECLVAT